MCLQVFRTDLAGAYVLGLGPPVIYLFLCFVLKADTQVYIATIATGFYAVIMMAVLVGTIVQIASEGIFGVSGVFLVCKYSYSVVPNTTRHVTPIRPSFTS